MSNNLDTYLAPHESYFQHYVPFVFLFSCLGAQWNLWEISSRVQQ